MTSEVSWQNSISLCPASFHKAKFACYSRCFLTSYFCIPVPYNLFGVLVLVGFHRTGQLQLLQHCCLGHKLGLPQSMPQVYHSLQYSITWIFNGLPWKQTEIFLSFLRLHPSTAFWTFLLTMMATPFLLRDSCPQQQI